MCGIIGSVGTYSQKDIKKGLNLLSHRGPDATGLYVDEGVIFGHRRLAIIDLNSAANQPMVSVDGLAVIVFNGEIYNYRELRVDLERKRVIFRTESDTEVILAGYLLEGIKFFQKMRGMWALAIYDKKAKRVILSRDVLGIKPLLYKVDRRGLLFTSEMKALLAITGEKNPNTENYYQFFNLGYFIAPQTCFRDVYRVEPGKTLVWDIVANKMVDETLLVFDLKPRDRAELITDPDQVVVLADSLLRDSVEAHFVSDVPVGLLFSGGNDSSLIAALAKKLGKDPIAFHLSIKNSPDTYYAEAIARELKLDLVRIDMNEQKLISQYDKIWEVLDEPTADVSIIPTTLIYQSLKGKAKVILGGDGGDELFGGYLRHRNLVMAPKIFLRNNLVSRLNRGYGHSKFSLNYLNPFLSRINKKILSLQQDLLGTYLREVKILDWPLSYSQVRNKLFTLWTNHPQKDLIPTSLFFDMLVYLPNDLFYKTDIASMSSSLEARVPLADSRLYSQLLGRVSSDFWSSRDRPLKFIMKKVLRKYLPPELVYRGKRGFGFSFQHYSDSLFSRDLELAWKFHCQNREAFGLDDNWRKLFIKENLPILKKKYPRFCFALVANWKIFDR